MGKIIKVRDLKQQSGTNILQYGFGEVTGLLHRRRSDGACYSVFAPL
jgi:hypothetical protein